MSILVRFEPQTESPVEKYNEAAERLDEPNNPPDGREYHVAFLVDGELRVSEIWDSQEAFQAYGEKLMPVLGELGIEPGEPQVFEVINTQGR